MTITSYRQLEVWQVSIELVESAYKLARAFPPEERFNLVSQLQRAVVSIPANIAEGWGRKHRKEYVHHLSIARGSLMEIETLLIIAVRLSFVTNEEVKGSWDLSQRVGKMLTALIGSLDK